MEALRLEIQEKRDLREGTWLLSATRISHAISTAAKYSGCRGISVTEARHL